MSTALFPQVLQFINSAQRRVVPHGPASTALDHARDRIADVAAKRIQITNKVRIIQAHATRGRGMTRVDLDTALEEVVQQLNNL